MMDGETKQCNIKMPIELHKRVGHVAIDMGVTFPKCIFTLLEEALKIREVKDKISR